MSQIRSCNSSIPQKNWDRIFGIKPFEISEEGKRKLKALGKKMRKNLAERDVREGGE